MTSFDHLKYIMTSLEPTQRVAYKSAASSSYFKDKIFIPFYTPTVMPKNMMEVCKEFENDGCQIHLLLNTEIAAFLVNAPHNFSPRP